MSRSTKKNPIHGITTAKSEKEDKKIWHSRARAKVRERLVQSKEDPEKYLDVLDKEVSDPWLMNKDGKSFSDPKEFQEVMRK